mmetsp:Transcript_37466/g.120406  ORF Transcript_37466/g.120406 Transcript_37466/m.120406 type:complete len:200 (+) Transcript_37466:740-1339(+)
MGLGLALHRSSPRPGAYSQGRPRRPATRSRRRIRTHPRPSRASCRQPPLTTLRLVSRVRVSHSNISRGLRSRPFGHSFHQSPSHMLCYRPRWACPGWAHHRQHRQRRHRHPRRPRCLFRTLRSRLPGTWPHRLRRRTRPSAPQLLLAHRSGYRPPPLTRTKSCGRRSRKPCKVCRRARPAPARLTRPASRSHLAPAPSR